MDYTNVQGRLNWSYGYFDGAAPYTAEDFKPMEYVQTMWGYEWKGPHKYLKLSREGGHPEAAAGRPVWAIRRWKSSLTGTLLDFVITPGRATDTSYDAAQFTARMERLKE